VGTTTPAPKEMMVDVKMEEIDRDLWNLRFGVEVSALYHDWRRGTMEAAQRFSRFATLVGIIFTLATAFNPLGWAPHVFEWVIAAILFGVACVNIAELTFRYNERAGEHLELYWRFSELLTRMSKPTAETNERLSDWQAEAAAIRRDEPPTMWAVYAMCWNQKAEYYRRGRDFKEHFRKIGWVRYLLRDLIQFRPKDFPPVAA
jgi:hypothetical protein